MMMKFIILYTTIRKQNKHAFAMKIITTQNMSLQNFIMTYNFLHKITK